MNDKIDKVNDMNIRVIRLIGITQELKDAKKYDERKSLIEEGRKVILEIYRLLNQNAQDLIKQAVQQNDGGPHYFNTNIASVLGFVNKSTNGKIKNREDSLGFIESHDFNDKNEQVNLILVDGVSMCSQSAKLARLCSLAFVLLSLLRVPIDAVTEICDALYASPGYIYDDEYKGVFEKDKSDLTINATYVSGSLFESRVNKNFFRFEGKISNDCSFFLLLPDGRLLIYNLGLHPPVYGQQTQIFMFNLNSTVDHVDSVFKTAVSDVLHSNKIGIAVEFPRRSIILLTTDGIFEKTNRTSRIDNIEVVLNTLKRLNQGDDIAQLSEELFNTLLNNSTSQGYDDGSAFVVHPIQHQNDPEARS